MKKIFVVLIVLGLLFVTIFAVQAQTDDETIYIHLIYSNDFVEVSSSDYIVLRNGWGACTLGLVKSYLSAVHTELTINDILVSAADGKDQYWEPITKVPDADWSSNCVVGNQNTYSVVWWNYPLNILAPGTYVVHFYYWLDNPVIDGTDIDGDGKLDRWNGVITDRIITIHVTE